MTAPAARVLIVEVRLHDGRYHGQSEWPPAPARLFQALLAGGTTSAEVDPDVAAALRWLEGLPAPVICAPRAWVGQEVKLWVPNNDLDAKGGDPSAVAELRTAKRVRPRIFDAETPLVYAWLLSEDGGGPPARRVAALALELYQLGRGVDMAWATASIVDEPAFVEILDRHPGEVYEPSPARTQKGGLPCPWEGSFASLIARHAATLRRFTDHDMGKRSIQLFQQPPKPLFRMVAYDTPPRSTLFDLRPIGEIASFASVHPTRAVQLVEAVRDAATARLKGALPDHGPVIERALVGREVEGTPRLPTSARVRLIPLPSIGHPHVDRGIRRLLVEVPAHVPLRASDVLWAFSGTVVHSSGDVELVITPADDGRMLEHYGARLDRRTAGPGPSRTWRTVTPAVLPHSAGRRRIDPGRRSEEAKGSAERLTEENRARAAVRQALRQAGVRVSSHRIHVQRESFEAKGHRAEAFAPGSRFTRERLWHVEIRFEQPIRGPLVIGDGRFLGLGLMVPHHESAVYTLRIRSGLDKCAKPRDVVRALRRALMERFANVSGTQDSLPPYVSGHQPTGQPADERSPHLFFTFEPESQRLLVVPPHVREHREPRSSERRHLGVLEQALIGLDHLRAGPAGLLSMEPAELLPDDDPLLAASERWVSCTPYVVDRHRKLADPALALTADVKASCHMAALPTPKVTVMEVYGVRGLGLTGRLELEFRTAVRGPILLGRSRHKGGGLFRAARREKSK